MWEMMQPDIFKWWLVAAGEAARDLMKATEAGRGEGVVEGAE